VSRKKGARYEQAARRFLESRQFQILETNYRYGRKEIDIIAIDGDELVFVEVKGGRSQAFGDPILRIDQRKQEAIIETAQGYLSEIKREYSAYRFDVVLVREERGQLFVEHRPAAFTL
jgi:putative endonuclease